MEMEYMRDQEGNKEVSKIIEDLKEEIISHFHPKSIIISGSFGKGEATIVAEENGKLKFLSDCEVIIIPYRWVFSRRRLDEFQQRFYRRTGLKIEIWGFTPTLYLTFPIFNKKIKPTIANYDLKYGSKIIYGRNYLDKIPAFKPEDIPLWEGVKLILNRMAEALEYFSLEHPTDEMVFWTDKIVLACQDALLLSLGKYHISFKKRNKIFIQSLTQFKIPHICFLAKLAVEATNRKLNMNSKNKILSYDPIKYWFKVQRICDEVFRHILEKGYSFKFSKYSEFPEKYMSSNLKSYTTLPFNNVILQNFFRFFKKKVIQGNLPTLKMLLKPYTQWDHLIYSLIPSLYFGLEDDCKVNSKCLGKIAEILSLFGKEISIGVLNEYSLQDWMNIKNTIVAYWREIRL